MFANQQFPRLQRIDIPLMLTPFRVILEILQRCSALNFLGLGFALVAPDVINCVELHDIDLPDNFEPLIFQSNFWSRAVVDCPHSENANWVFQKMSR